MIVMTKTFDLLNWLLPKSEKFPKIYRSTLTQRLMDAALDLQESLYAAAHHPGTNVAKHLYAADAQLTNLRLYLRLAHSFQLINDGQYRHASLMVAEIGKLVGSWIKTRKSVPQKP
jgi:hypothetical protein